MSGPGTPSLDQLQVFLTVVETGSFAAAGRKLGRATSAVSYAVATLEQQLGVQLFDRDRTRKPTLTEVGASVLAEARTVSMGVDSLRAKGLAAAAKKSSRTAAEGLVGVAVSGAGSGAAGAGSAGVGAAAASVVPSGAPSKPGCGAVSSGNGCSGGGFAGGGAAAASVPPRSASELYWAWARSAASESATCTFCSALVGGVGRPGTAARSGCCPVVAGGVLSSNQEVGSATDPQPASAAAIAAVSVNRSASLERPPRFSVICISACAPNAKWRVL